MVRERHFYQVDGAQEHQCRSDNKRPSVPHIRPNQQADNERQQELPGRDKGLNQHICAAGGVWERFHQRRVGTGVEEAVRQSRHNAAAVGQIDIFRQQNTEKEHHIAGNPEIDKGFTAKTVGQESGDDRGELANPERRNDDGDAGRVGSPLFLQIRHIEGN